MLRLFYFSTSEFRSGSIASDFDLRLIVGGVARVTQALAGARGDVDSTFPEVGAARQIIVNDAMFGRGGVRRVHRIADTPATRGVPDHPLVRQEIRLGALPDHMLIAIGGNPYAEDAVAGYWFSVRDLVRTALLGPARRSPPVTWRGARGVADVRADAERPWRWSTGLPPSAARPRVKVRDRQAVSPATDGGQSWGCLWGRHMPSASAPAPRRPISKGV